MKTQYEQAKIERKNSISGEKHTHTHTRIPQRNTQNKPSITTET